MQGYAASLCVLQTQSQFKLVTALRGSGDDYRSESAFLYCKTQTKQTENRQHKHINTFPDALCIGKTGKRLEDVSLVELARQTSCTQEVQSALSSAAWTPFKCINLTKIQQDFVWGNHISTTGIMFSVLFVFRSNLVEDLVIG